MESPMGIPIAIKPHGKPREKLHEKLHKMAWDPVGSLPGSLARFHAAVFRALDCTL